ncbi:MAG: hypothetical protein ACO4AU_11230 [bacterium]|jgi:hypothetical protein
MHLPLLKITHGYYFLLEDTGRGVVGHYVVFRDPQELSAPERRLWVQHAENSEERSFRIWMSVVEAVFAHHYQLSSDRSEHQTSLYHFLQAAPSDLVARIEDWWSLYSQTPSLLS